ncbi:hypothetical protein A6R68_23787 [Neotoma lepida]|uniref:Secreted protein n=1 Tax=Neotoma lepida TaxID=56216 RepID=A0A1A6HWW7_NEOLE|nr:hypothetical protein A6R68_23787 [Neotoma lepida]
MLARKALFLSCHPWLRHLFLVAQLLVVQRAQARASRRAGQQVPGVELCSAPGGEHHPEEEKARIGPGISPKINE